MAYFVNLIRSKTEKYLSNLVEPQEIPSYLICFRTFPGVENGLSIENPCSKT